MHPTSQVHCHLQQPKFCCHVCCCPRQNQLHCCPAMHRLLPTPLPFAVNVAPAFHFSCQALAPNTSAVQLPRNTAAKLQPDTSASTHISFSQRFLHTTRNSRNFSNTRTRGKRSSNGDEGCCHSASSPRPSSTRLHQASNRSSCPGSSKTEQRMKMQ